MNVSSIGPIINPEARALIPPVEEKPSTTFADLLRQVIASDAVAQQGVDSYAIGTNQNLHETMIAIEKADITLSLMVNVRNKLLEAYREVMRMS